ncbi:GntR family transcriptional regulator [Pseudooceanicola sp. CBS1P-1]|uniref:GntR family transcriptional regulator n=1 Tax=Pseudooceanicola TaxID=1679449 RepID=UPI001927975C|nr:MULTISPECIES: GntR family transcriptional regulator [Pseudooceanicola]MBT9384124.1 GntR family transcriptional regulator [Pseudooceanicola endophyticus]
MRKNSNEIAATIRERICLTRGDDIMLLHEGQLATEFGVSRTPVRQVLQMLAYERLVETRSGVGTIVTPLLPERRTQDETAFRALLDAAAACPLDGPVPQLCHARLIYARQALRGDDCDLHALYAAMSGMMDATSGLVADDIVATALRAAWLRHIRWAFQGADAPSVSLHPKLGAGLIEALGAESSAADLLRILVRVAA